MARTVRVLLIIAAALLLAAAATVLLLVRRFQPMAREYVESALAKRYQSEVSLGGLQFSFWPDVRAAGENLTLRFHGRKDGPPMVSIRRFTIRASLKDFFRAPKHIDSVTLEGLQLHIPPRSASAAVSGVGPGTDSDISFVLDEVSADGATLEMPPDDPKKTPLVFEIDEIRLRSVGRGTPMTFHAVVENAKPPGRIHSDGSFGPWAAASPAETALSGAYTFRDADLSVFKGVSGRLASEGKYDGRLNSIEVRGAADVPDFALSVTDRPMPLHTDFTATVDGTNGDTVLHPVHAQLGRSAFEVIGSIERGALDRHKEIDLQAMSASSRVEDFLRLAVAGQKAALTGALRFNTSVKIPPGETPVVGRLQLAGTFGMREVRFTNQDIESKIATLSHYGVGNPKDPSTEVPADFEGRFRLANGVLGLPQFQFAVPGADVELAGNYALADGAINFTGHARLRTKLSQMTTGWKSWLVRPIDHMLARDGAGVDLPISIKGTRKDPQFKIDFGQILRRF